MDLKYKYLKYKKKYLKLKKGGALDGPWQGNMFQNRISDVTEILKTKITQHWDSSQFMKNVRETGFELDSLDVVLENWNDDYSKLFLECITGPKSGVAGNISIQNRNYKQVLEMFVDLKNKIEREDMFPLIWPDDGMLFIIEILYNKSPFRDQGCFNEK